MRRIYLSFFAFFLALGMEAQTMVKVQVTNPSKVERNDEPVVLDLSKYGEVSKAVVTVDGKEIPSQLDDLNRDCVNDELCFLANLGKRESKTYQIQLFSEGEQSVYPARTFAELVVTSRIFTCAVLPSTRRPRMSIILCILMASVSRATSWRCVFISTIGRPSTFMAKSIRDWW